MKLQTPAEGILKSNEWGDTRSYHVICDCGQPDHSHNVWIEAEDTGITVTIYATVKSPWWKWNRFKQIWQLLTKGYIDYETVITFNEQVAFNYAETLKSAIEDVKIFKQESKWRANLKNRITNKSEKDSDRV
mgnify:CR=1 FL=1